MGGYRGPNLLRVLFVLAMAGTLLAVLLPALARM